MSVLNVFSRAVAFALLAAIGWGATAPTCLGEEPPAEALRFFETKIRPIFAEHCQKCHGPEKQWSSFRLDSREAILRGGDFGTAVVPGKPDEGLLLSAVRQTDPDLMMPPKGKLTDAQIADLETWIRQGAHFPAEIATKSRFRDPQHWSFQKVAQPSIPVVVDPAWPQSPIDHFILARLESLQLAPAKTADKRTLIRRATFDLTGLPPTPAEVDAFLSDDRPDAFARLVDRLLESPAYGERWGRHWLDVARYADSNGLDENIAHGNAWRYRDYVVASLNSDKPYRQFVREQLAGDLLPAASDAQRAELYVATGFLAIGPKVLAEPDKTKMEMDIIDEQIDTVGKALLGLTLGCARCHDHKFDPIETADYYALAGIFKSTKTMESLKTIAKWHENRLPDTTFEALKSEYDRQLSEKKSALDQLIASATQQIPEPERKDLTPENLEKKFSEEVQKQLAALRADVAAFEKQAPEPPAAMGVTEQGVVDVSIHIRGSHLKLGDLVPRRTPVVFTSTAAPTFSTSQSGRLELADWITASDHPLTYRVLVNRVWRWHFGKGIVRSPDNFGMLGELPTHPELLDWLTQKFIEQGTSLKSLHRLIMLSSTYQQSSIPSDQTKEKDPENLLWGRFETRRLEAEAVRDSLLAVGGQLDHTRGGSLLQVKNREFFFDHTSKDKTSYATHRRSLYLPIVRNHVYDLFQLLDYPDAAVTTGDRATTTVAPQALLMLNSDLVAEASSGLAQQLLVQEADTASRVKQAIARAYAREATAAEITAAAQFLTRAEELLQAKVSDADLRHQQAWQAYCQTLLAANEFIYVR